jgi:hypothetical protein
MDLYLSMAAQLNVALTGRDGSYDQITPIILISSSLILTNASTKWEIPVPKNISEMLQTEEADLLWQLMFHSLLFILSGGN